MKKTVTIVMVIMVLLPAAGFCQFKRAFPCGDPNTIGWAGNSPDNNDIPATITEWRPNLRYEFHGKFSWDKRQKTTNGEILLKKDGALIAQIASWNSSAPGTASIEQDITRYISTKGSYSVEWKYKGGNSGVCILQSEIAPSP
jgi:hypothetical protein